MSPSDPIPFATPDDEDRQLVERIRRAAGGGDSEAWTELLRRHQDRLFAICLRMVGKTDAADVCQTALVKIIQGLPGFDARSQLATWMVRITMNACLSHLRSAKLRRHSTLEQDSDADRVIEGSAGENREPGGDWGVQRSEAQSRVGAALLTLDDQQRAILVLRDVRGLDYSQIATAVGVAEGTVKSRLFRAREALRQAVEKLEEQDRANPGPKRK